MFLSGTRLYGYAVRSLYGLAHKTTGVIILRERGDVLLIVFRGLYIISDHLNTVIRTNFVRKISSLFSSI